MLTFEEMQEEYIFRGFSDAQLVVTAVLEERKKTITKSCLDSL